MLFSLCEKELTIDFINIAEFHNIFMSEFNALNYIEDNESLELINPQQFVRDYQEIIEAYLQTQSLRCQELLLEKKYLLYIVANKNRFYELYQNKYMSFFKCLDDSISKEYKLIQTKAIYAMKILNEREVH